MQLNSKGQVWIETVIYTLIALSLIAIVLGFVTPKINESRDRAMVQQGMNSLNQIDEQINDVLSSEGNKRIIELNLRKGDFYVLAAEGGANKIRIVLSDLSKPYSQANQHIQSGRIDIISYVARDVNYVNLTLDYDGEIALTHDGQLKDAKLSPASVPYKLAIEYVDSETKTVDIKEINE